MKAAPTPVPVCHIRRAVSEADFLALDQIYLAHEGVALPKGYFEDFQETIRDPHVLYLLAEKEGKIIAGGGIIEEIKGLRVIFCFGLVHPDYLKRGYGTALLLARISLLEPGPGGCQIVLEATELSASFFASMGFTWHGSEDDEDGNVFYHGAHTVFQKDPHFASDKLTASGVTVDPTLALIEAPEYMGDDEEDESAG